MLTLERRWGRSIYSLSANGGEVKGYMGLGPEHCAQTGTGRPLGTGRPVSQELSDIRCPPVVRWFRSVMGVPDVRRLWTYADLGSGAVAPVVRLGLGVRSFALGAGAPVIRSGPDVRWLGLG